MGYRGIVGYWYYNKVTENVVLIYGDEEILAISTKGIGWGNERLAKVYSKGGEVAVGQVEPQVDVELNSEDEENIAMLGEKDT